jgi:hypothetical protein
MVKSLSTAIALVALGFTSVAHGAEPSRAAPLTAAEQHALAAGSVVTRPMELERGTGSYVGGLSYQVVRASPEEVWATLTNVDELPNVLPRTLQARLVAAEPERAWVELVQGNDVVKATYTVVLQRAVGSETMRFWLDRSRPHDISDAWGYFRVQPFGRRRSLVTVAVAVDVGSGLVRLLFESRVQALVLSTPQLIRDAVEPRVFAAR